jgi:uncharacterized phiE125 gp8 family phage protein
MRRVELVAANLSGEALAELKQWLGITRPDEDAQLVSLLAASLDMCEGFTGQIALEAQFEEVVRPCDGWCELASRPVRAITGVEAQDASGMRSALGVADYALEIDADGTGKVQLTGNISAPHSLVIQFAAGLAAEWASLPDALRHGIIRLAAHHYRERDASKAVPPPASVTALWRPWRKVRLT